MKVVIGVQLKLILKSIIRKVLGTGVLSLSLSEKLVLYTNHNAGSMHAGRTRVTSVLICFATMRVLIATLSVSRTASLPVGKPPAGTASLPAVSCWWLRVFQDAPGGCRFTSFLPPAQQEYSGVKTTAVTWGGEMSECVGARFQVGDGKHIFSVILDTSST